MWPARAYWICQFAGWGLWTVVNAFLYAGYSGSTSFKGVLTALWLGAAGLFSSHLMRWWMLRRQWTTRPARSIPLRVAALTIVASLAITAVNLLAMIYLFRWFDWKQTRPSGYVSSGLLWCAVFLLWQAIYFAAHWFARSRQAEIETARLDFLLLRSQLNPHFLFNCLNSIRALIAEDPPRAQHAVTLLSDLLRYTLQARDRAQVTLDEELAMVDEYVALEQIRFEDRLRIRREIEPGSGAAHLPPMLLQTLVENAIKHGIAASHSGGEVTIESALVQGALHLRVTNPGNLPDTPLTHGVGLRYANRADFRLAQDNGRISAEVRIPQ